VDVSSEAHLPRSQATAALLAAAGEGVRLGRGAKAFLTVGGTTLLERAVAALSTVAGEVVVAVPASGLERARRLVPDARVVAGGATRQETVFELLRTTHAELVLVHDVARPFLPRAVAERVLAAASVHGAASAARPIADTLVSVEDREAVDRDALRGVQTPQAFRRELLLRAHRAARDGGREATDDAALVRALGHEVELVDGSPWLFKLTVSEDADFAEALASAWEQARQAPAGDG
jgi:2-C-methyl-D-erythritol 4-phosphate cytidylyltransferase